jgi:hypothetical protein
MLVRDSRQSRDIADVPCGISDTLAEYGTCIFVDLLFDATWLVGIGEEYTDALARQDVGE